MFGSESSSFCDRQGVRESGKEGIWKSSKQLANAAEVSNKNKHEEESENRLLGENCGRTRQSSGEMLEANKNKTQEKGKWGNCRENTIFQRNLVVFVRICFEDINNVFRKTRKTPNVMKNKVKNDCRRCGGGRRRWKFREEAVNCGEEKENTEEMRSAARKRRERQKNYDSEKFLS